MDVRPPTATRPPGPLDQLPADLRPVVVIAEDDPALRMLTSRTLELAGFAVVEVWDGEAAVDATVRLDPALVVLDIGLPGLDGLGVLRRLRELGDVPVILATGASSEPDRLRGLELGADDYLIKPFYPRELAARACAILRRTAPRRPLASASAGSTVAAAVGAGGARLDEVAERLVLESELARAVHAGELRLDYQPVFTLADGGVRGAEALVRWQHPTRGLLAPGAFIEIAEDSGLIVAIGEWILWEACREAATWTAPAPAPSVAVNLSARQLADPGLPALVARVLRGTGLPAERLMLEVTETAMIEDLPRFAGAIGRIRESGVRVALDDFGTGYCSLAYVQELQVDELKLDRSFVTDLGASSPSVAIVTAVLAMATTLGFDVVAEGIETAEQAAVLTGLGCRYGQGFHLGRPMPAAALRLLLCPDPPAARPAA